MKVRAAQLYALAARHFGKREAEAALYGRRLGEARPPIGFPQGRPGPGGGIFVERAEQAALYLLGLAASPTAQDAPEAVRVYRDLRARTVSMENLLDEVRREHERVAHELGYAYRTLARHRAEGRPVTRHTVRDIFDFVLGRAAAGPHPPAAAESWEPEASALLLDWIERQEQRHHALGASRERMEAGVEPLPGVFRRLRDEPHTLLEAFTALLDYARTDEGGACLAINGVLRVDVSRARPNAGIVVNAPGAVEWFAIRYEDPEGAEPTRDVDYPAVFTGRLFADFGAVLGADDAPAAEPPTEREGAPSTEANGAPSVSHRPAKAGARTSCKPRANADSPATDTGQSITAATRIPAFGPAGGSPPPSWPRRRGARCTTASASPP